MGRLQALPLALQCLHDVRNSSDLAMRQAASQALWRLVDAMASLERQQAEGQGGDDDAPESLLRLAARVLYPQVGTIARTHGAPHAEAAPAGRRARARGIGVGSLDSTLAATLLTETVPPGNKRKYLLPVREPAPLPSCPLPSCSSPGQEPAQQPLPGCAPGALGTHAAPGSRAAAPLPRTAAAAQR